MQEWNANITVPRRFSMRDPLVCQRLFATNKIAVTHSYPNLYK